MFFVSFVNNTYIANNNYDPKKYVYQSFSAQISIKRSVRERLK